MLGLKIKNFCLGGELFSSLLYLVSFEETELLKREKNFQIPRELFFTASQPVSLKFLKSYLVKITSQRDTEDSKGIVLPVAILAYVIL